MIRKPMLAASRCLSCEDLCDLNFPVLASIKEDGIRCTQQIRDARIQPLSRKLIEIPNQHVQEWAEHHGVAGLDGELVLPGKSFHEIQSWMMTKYTLPRPFEYRVFDHTGYRDHPLLQRLQTAKRLIEWYGVPNTKMVEQKEFWKPDALWDYFLLVIESGEEGLIVSSPSGPYKQGRSTFNQQYRLKMKMYEDREARILDFIPEYENRNVQVRDPVGQAKRSSHKANRHARKRLGALVVQDLKDGTIFNLGSGYSREQKVEIWKNQADYQGAIVTYKTQIHGRKDKPRTPIFKGVRRD